MVTMIENSEHTDMSDSKLVKSMMKEAEGCAEFLDVCVNKLVDHIEVLAALGVDVTSLMIELRLVARASEELERKIPYTHRRHDDSATG